jgi:hypothetical protein
MVTVSEKMTALADEIRELSGTATAKSLGAMQVDVDAANAEIAEQTELLEQIATALEGKAAGGSSEVIQTCTVKITTNANVMGVFYQTYSNGIIISNCLSPMSVNLTEEQILTDVICNSMIVAPVKTTWPAVTVNGTEVSSSRSMIGCLTEGAMAAAFNVVAQAGQTVTVRVFDDD